MGILGFGSKKNVSLTGSNPKKVKKDMEQWRLRAEQLTVDLRAKERLIEARLNDAASPTLSQQDKRGKAIEIAQVKDEKSLIEHQLADARKKFRIVANEYNFLQASQNYSSDVLKAIEKLGPEAVRARVEAVSLANKERNETYDSIINNGQIFTEAATFELDAGSLEVLAEIEKREKELN